MDPSLSMNTMSGPVDLNELERRAKAHAAQRSAYEAQQRDSEAAAGAERFTTSDATSLVRWNRSGRPGLDAAAARAWSRLETMAKEDDAELQSLQSEAGHNQRAVTQNVAYGSGGAMRIVSADKIAQQSRAPGKMFTRSDILAILRAKQAECRSPRRLGQTPDGLLVLAELVDAFENLE